MRTLVLTNACSLGLGFLSGIAGAVVAREWPWPVAVLAALLIGGTVGVVAIAQARIAE